MSVRRPHAGLVISYSYLWRREHERGQEEGLKDRPCAVILVTQTEDDAYLVTVLPISHSPPFDPQHGLELPAATRKRLGLDDERQWIMLTEANRFLWPGPDVRFGVGGDAARCDFGFLPAKLYEQMRDRFLELAKTQRPPITARTE